MPEQRSIPESPWLTDREQAAWRAYILSSLRLMALLDRELQHRADLPMSYYEILAMLSEAPERALRMSDLAEATHSLPSRITHAVGRMEKAGWIEKRNCETDRRAWYATLTDAGMRVVEAAAPVHVDGVRRHLIDQLDAEDLDDLERIFTKVKGYLDGPWASCSEKDAGAKAGAADAAGSACDGDDAESESDDDGEVCGSAPC
jgi:DNA-binding MarR family transcriptional regulator